MQRITGKPELMKKMNMTLIYQALIDNNSATRSEISDITRISITTIRTLLDELLRNEDILELELDESSGGRRAQRYSINTSRNLILSAYIEEMNVIYQIKDLLGNKVLDGEIELSDNINMSAALFMEKTLLSYDICAVGFGAAGIIKDNMYYTIENESLVKINTFIEQIRSNNDIQMVLENDLNAIAVGYANDTKRYNAKNNIIYIHFNESCTGAGIISEGKIVRGATNFAGEVGFLPIYNHKTFDEIVKSEISVNEATQAVVGLIAILNCVVNPDVIVIGGDRFKKAWIDIEMVKNSLESKESSFFNPKIILSQGYKKHYLDGLTHQAMQMIVPKL